MMSIFRVYLMFLTLSTAIHLEAANPPIFENTISVSEFGAIANTVASLQPGTYNNLTAASLRTNDFQNLQMNYQLYASSRGITRIGSFLISQGGNASTVGPNGPGVSFPALCFSNDYTSNPANPAQNITTNVTSTMLVFTAAETATFTLTGDLDGSETRQAAILKYVNPSNAGQYIVDYNIIGNAFHDMLYNGLTPIINADSFTHLKEVTVFSSAFPGGTTITNPVPPDNHELPPGYKFRITVLNTQTNQTQTWLLYLQPPDNATPTLPEVTFHANFNGSFSNILVGQAPFNGFARTGIIQNTPVPFSPLPNPTASEVVSWSTSLGIQAIASTPASMYILWPTEFTAKATQKIATNFSGSVYLPYCPWLSIYLPLVSLNNFSLASNYFNCLMNGIPPLKNVPYPFDGSTNPFLSYFNMLLAKVYASDIAAYQASNRPFPSYGITATPQSIESVYDSYRDVIPINAEIAFNTNDYEWTYTTLIRSTSTQTQPLIVFPGYKTLKSPLTSVAGFEVLDPIKGPLYATQAQSNTVSFQEPGLPDFLNSQYFPEDFWDKLTSAERTTLLGYWKTALKNQLAPENILFITNLPDGYGNAKVLYQVALSTNYGTYLLQKNGMAPSDIKTATQPTINAVNSVVQDWLINIQKNMRQQQGANFPSPFVQNFFVGDTTVQGLCYSIRGMLGGSNSFNVGQDFGNAAYNDHHFAEGYWLGAIAASIEWDNTFGPIAPNPETTPWIAQTFTSAVGSGPFKLKAFVDMLWRDARNPDPNDPDFPYNRHGNPWEGHSTANGLNLSPFAAGRNQESLAEDFNSWLSTLNYARAIQKIYANPSFTGALTATDVEGFSTLEKFCTLNLQLTATAGNLYYNTSHWPYAALGFNFNVTAAQQYDNFVDTATFFKPGTPACNCTSEDVINSPTRLESFYEEYLDF